MKTLAEMLTVDEVDEFIDKQICRNRPGLRERAESGNWTVAERVEDPGLDAVLKALERRDQLQTSLEKGERGLDA